VAGGSSGFAKNFCVIRVRIPLDLHAVAVDGSSAFALATPLRVRDLLALTVREAIGTRAPGEKFQRNVRQTLDGLEHGDFLMTIDDRIIHDPDDVVVCSGTVNVRFYCRHKLVLAQSGI